LDFIKKWKLKACIALIDTHNSMHWFIVSKGLFKEFMDFDLKYKKNPEEVTTKIKEKQRRKPE